MNVSPFVDLLLSGVFNKFSDFTVMSNFGDIGSYSSLCGCWDSLSSVLIDLVLDSASIAVSVEPIYEIRAPGSEILNLLSIDFTGVPGFDSYF